MHVEGDGQKAYVKGAPSETLGALHAPARSDGDVVPMTDELREQIVAQNDDMSRQALRVLAVCERDLPNELTDYTPDAVETDLTFLGLVGMIDPPRPEVSEAVEQALARRHPHHHGHRRLRPDRRGDRPPHRHRPRRQARARHHRRRPRGA